MRATARGVGDRRWGHRLLRIVVVLGLCAPAAGCAYYNSMYNAKRRAKQAEESERAGRTAEARERWRLASIHAESLLSRYPRSRWADDARLLRGQALVQVEAYGDAVDALRRVVAEAQDDRTRALAQLYLGRAYAALRMYPDALASFDDAVRITDPGLRAEAELQRGRVRLIMGDPAGAMDDLLASTTPDARLERVRAALALHDAERAAGFAEEAVTVPAYREAVWLALLDSLGRAGMVERASTLTDRLVARGDVGRGARARLYLADGDRLLASGASASAAARFADILRDVPDSTEGRAAEVRLARLELRAGVSDEERSRLRQRLEQAAARGGEPGRLAQDLAAILDMADTLMARDSGDGAFAYLGAEVLRDSIPAPALAASAFVQMATRWPSSPWAPKALLAAVHAGHPAADSLLAVLAERYAASPYAVAARGGMEADSGYALLEDSLRTVLGAALATVPPATPSLVPGRPGVGPADAGVRPTPGMPAGVRTPTAPRPARPTSRPAPDP